MKESYLLGFYRKENKIESLYSDNPYFTDSNLVSQFKAVIVPLGMHVSTFPWNLSNDSSLVNGSLKVIFDRKMFFVTQTESSTPFSVLMYSKVNDMSMSRGGILLEKNASGYKPVTVEIDGVEYITEIKGCGCPLNGFPAMHIRKQSRSYNKGHLRLTGGLDSESAKEEFDNLESRRKIENELNGTLHYRALGYITFNYYLNDYCVEMGVVLRLSPSSIRLSFTKNKAIDKLQTGNLNTFLFNAGREVSTLLECDEPRIHRNMSWNNMVYLDRNNYIFTDYEEASPASSGHCALDFIEHIYPHCFLVERFRDSSFKDFLLGLESIEGRVKRAVVEARPQDIEELNRVVIEDCLSLPVFRSRRQKTSEYSFIDENISLIKTYMPEDYFFKDINNWISTTYLPEMVKKRKVCEFYMKFLSSFGLEDFTRCIRFEHVDMRLQSRFVDEVQKIIPQFNKEFLDITSGCSIKDLGVYMDNERFETIYIDLPLSQDDIEKRINNINRIIDDTNCYLKTGKFKDQICYVTDLLSERKSYRFKDAMSTIFPFVVFINVYLANEKMILTGVQKHKDVLTEDELYLCEKSLNEIEVKARLLRDNPECYHSILKESADRLKLYLKLPYMR